MKRSYKDLYPVKVIRYFYLSFSPTNNPRENTVNYSSEAYRFSHIDILSLIRLCYKDKRLIIIGRKIINIYLDSAGDTKAEALATLSKMGIDLANNDTSRGLNDKHR